MVIRNPLFIINTLIKIPYVFKYTRINYLNISKKMKNQIFYILYIK